MRMTQDDYIETGRDWVCSSEYLVWADLGEGCKLDDGLHWFFGRDWFFGREGRPLVGLGSPRDLYPGGVFKRSVQLRVVVPFNRDYCYIAGVLSLRSRFLGGQVACVCVREHVIAIDA